MDQPPAPRGRWLTLQRSPREAARPRRLCLWSTRLTSVYPPTVTQYRKHGTPHAPGANLALMTRASPSHRRVRATMGRRNWACASICTGAGPTGSVPPEECPDPYRRPRRRLRVQTRQPAGPRRRLDGLESPTTASIASRLLDLTAETGSQPAPGWRSCCIENRVLGPKPSGSSLTLDGSSSRIGLPSPTSRDALTRNHARTSVGRCRHVRCRLPPGRSE